MANCARVTHGAYVSVHIPTYPIPRAQPAHHFVRATGVVRRPKAGRRGRRPLRAVCLLYVAAYNLGAQPAHHFVRANPSFPLTQAGRAWKISPYGVLVKFQLTAGVVRHPARGASGAYFIMRFITAILALVSGLYRRGGSPGKRRRMPSRWENSSKLQRP